MSQLRVLVCTTLSDTKGASNAHCTLVYLPTPNPTYFLLQLWVIVCEEFCNNPSSQPMSNVQTSLVIFILVKDSVSKHWTEVLQDRQVTSVGRLVEGILGTLEEKRVRHI